MHAGKWKTFYFPDLKHTTWHEGQGKAQGTGTKSMDGGDTKRDPSPLIKRLIFYDLVHALFVRYCVQRTIKI